MPRPRELPTILLPVRDARLLLAFAFGALACGPAETATVTEMPPQALPTATVTLQAAPPPAEPMPLQAGEDWVGTYQCAQGVTDLVVHVDRVMGTMVAARFEFSHAPSGAAGMYEMRGTVLPDGRAHLVPGRWIQQPPGYVGVGMTGQVRGDVFVGRIDGPSCGGFSVQRR